MRSFSSRWIRPLITIPDSVSVSSVVPSEVSAAFSAHRESVAFNSMTDSSPVKSSSPSITQSTGNVLSWRLKSAALISAVVWFMYSYFLLVIFIRSSKKICQLSVKKLIGKLEGQILAYERLWIILDIAIRGVAIALIAVIGRGDEAHDDQISCLDAGNARLVEPPG